MNRKELILIRNVTQAYGGGARRVTAVKDVTFSVGEGEFVSLIGPSGCGKSTIIKLLAGLLLPTEGEILENGQRASYNDRSVMFQQYTLFPWLTVEENIGFGLAIRNSDKRRMRGIVSHYVGLMGLRGFEKAYPKELSGGMQQRASLARTLATDPKILLLDEPFSALDVQTRRFMQDLLLQVRQREHKRTIVLVTHDVDEAIFMSDTIYVLSARPGTIKERVKIDLPRPRTLDTEFSGDFVKLKKHVQTLITKESLGLMALDLDVYKNLR
jgi:ABC-type nitrate/sulfonate/bicarbonate transport system ATPase subunit